MLLERTGLWQTDIIMRKSLYRRMLTPRSHAHGTPAPSTQPHVASNPNDLLFTESALLHLLPPLKIIYETTSALDGGDFRGRSAP